MRKLIRKYYQEIIAVLLIVGFWGSIWGYHAYQAYQTNAYLQAHATPYNPALIK
jgi:hypothetical protein